MLRRCVFPYVFFNCYLAARWQFYGGGSLTHPIVITVLFDYFDQMVTKGAKYIIIVHCFLQSKSSFVFISKAVVHGYFYYRFHYLNWFIGMLAMRFSFYSETSLLKTTLGPQNSVRYREICCYQACPL